VSKYQAFISWLTQALLTPQSGKVSNSFRIGSRFRFIKKCVAAIEGKSLKSALKTR
jgi:hypothetical protein